MSYNKRLKKNLFEVDAFKSNMTKITNQQIKQKLYPQALPKAHNKINKHFKYNFNLNNFHKTSKHVHKMNK